MRQHHSPPAKGLTCVRTLSRIHATLCEDPFRMIKGALAGVPDYLGYNCIRCKKPVRRGFTQPALTGFQFSFFACSCTGLSRFSEVGDPSPKQWGRIVAEAAQLAPGQVKVHTRVMDEPPEAGGPS